MRTRRNERKIEVRETLIWLIVLKSIELTRVVPEIKD